jgi:5-(carboxyamino)imidazole ribonucleotide mutase
MATVLIILGSKSDIEIGRKAVSTLEEFGIEADMAVASAHRTPDRVRKMVERSEAKVFIAVAGMSAALPGAVASYTVRPVIGVPVSGNVNLDSILSIVQMPPGVPVAAVGIDRGENAALLAIEILALGDERLRKALVDHRRRMEEQVESDSAEVGS